MSGDQPPRPIAVGDVVAVYSEALNEWTASQITGIGAAGKSVAVLELDWSGPEPGSLADLGELRPLRLTHHQWAGRIAHANQDWVLPRSFTVIGSAPPLVTEASGSYSPLWGRGEQLACQRHWDAGHRESWTAPYALTCEAGELDAAEVRHAVRSGVRHLTVQGITRLDCAELVDAFPGLTRLSLSGNLGVLTSAGALNRLAGLQALTLRELFGMDAADCLLPRHVPGLEQLWLDGIPADYAAAMRRAWRPQVRHGVQLDVRGARKADWIAANAANPLRDWDGQEHIPPAAYRKAVAQYERTRDAFLASVTGDECESGFVGLGRDFAAAFNALDRAASFIATVEREELYDALDFLVEHAQASVGRDLGPARAALIRGVDAVRDW